MSDFVGLTDNAIHIQPSFPWLIHMPSVSDLAILYCSADVADTSSPSVVDEVCLFRVVIQNDCEPSMRSTVATTT